MPSIAFTDSTGAATITSLSPRFRNWVPDARNVGPRTPSLGTGLLSQFAHRTDYVATFDMTNIAHSEQSKLVRLKLHLLGGGSCTVTTDDLTSNVYTCYQDPQGAEPSWSLDGRNLEFTLSLALKNGSAAALECIYDDTLSTPVTLPSVGGASIVKTGTGSPEGSVSGIVGTLYLQQDGDYSQRIWHKETGSGSTGWVLFPLALPAAPAPVSAVGGVKRVYERVAYTTSSSTNFASSLNSNFASGDLTSWTASDAGDTSVVSSGGKQWGQMAAAAAASSTLTSSTATIPTADRGKPLEVSLLCSGYINSITVRDQTGTTLRSFPLAALLPATADGGARIRVILSPADYGSATGISIRVFKGNDAAHAAELTSITEWQVCVADERYVPQSRLGLPPVGATLTTTSEDERETWLTTAWDEAAVRGSLETVRRLGPVIRLWITADTLSTFNGSGVWQSFNATHIAHLDRLFELCEAYGLRVIPTIFSQTAWSGVSYSEEIVTDAAVRAGYVAMCGAIAARYKDYHVIAAWDICNETTTTLTEHAGFPNKHLYLLEARTFLTEAYDAIKAEDPTRPVIASWADYLNPLAQPEDYCDVIGYSFYLGTSSDTATILTDTVSSGDEAVTYLVDQVMPWIATELGAPTDVNAVDPDDSVSKALYRIPSVNDDFLLWYYTNLWEYGAEAAIAWHSPDVLWDVDTAELNLAGGVVRAASAMLPSRPELPLPRPYQIGAFPSAGGTITGASTLSLATDTANGLALLASTTAHKSPRLFLGNSTDGNGVAFYSNNGALEVTTGAVAGSATGTTRVSMTSTVTTVSNNFRHTGSQLGFYNAATAAKPTVSGSRGGNAALASLLTALATLGLITDSSSA